MRGFAWPAARAVCPRSGCLVIFLITGLAYGGAETQMVRLATRLKGRGWEVRVVSLMPPLAYVEELELAGIPVLSLGVRWKIPNLRVIVQLARLIRKWRPDIVHSFMVHANLLARLVRPLAFVPVLMCSARSIDEGGRLRQFLYRLTDPLCNLTTQVSQAGLERYVRVGVVPRHKIRYVPNGVDTERFRPDPRVRGSLRGELHVEEEFTWLAVGRFAPPKDYPSMLNAFSHAAEEQPNAVLLIAGDGPLRSSMEEMVGRLVLEKQVRFLGLRRDVHDLMNVADAYVMSSAWEGMPNVLLEAAASGLPLVATDVGGDRDVVVEGETGFLVPPKDPEALAHAMLRLMALPKEQRQRMGEAGRLHIEANFSIDRVVDQWEDLYRELLKKKGIVT